MISQGDFEGLFALRLFFAIANKNYTLRKMVRFCCKIVHILHLHYPLLLIADATANINYIADVEKTD